MPDASIAPRPRAHVQWASRPPLHHHAVALATDPKGVPQACFLAEQILEKETERRFDVVVCVMEHALIPQPLLDSDIRFCQIDHGAALRGFPSSAMIPLAAYLRLLMPEAFLGQYQRVLYMDTDVYLRRPGLGGLLESPQMTGRVALAPDLQAIGTQDWLESRDFDRYRAGLGLPESHIYRNSGVMLMDLPAMAAHHDGQRILEYAHFMADKLRHHDQSAINGAIGEDIELLSMRWNLQQFPGLQDRADELDAVLLHFTSWPKPWDAVCDPYRSRFRPEYQAYFARRFPGYAEQAAKHFGPGGMARLTPWLRHPRQAWRNHKRQKSVPFRKLTGIFPIDEEKYARLLADPRCL